MIPDYKVTVNGKELTPTLNAVLLSLEINELNGEEADTLRLELDDSKGEIALPSHGAEIHIFIGWKSQELVDKGTYTVDEIEHQGAPDRVVIHARSAAMVNSLPGKKSRSWYRVTLYQVVSEIADEHNLTPVVGDDLANLKLAAPQQTAESDLHFLTRLAKGFDAIATVKSNYLLFVKKGAAKTASGKAMPTVEVERTSTTRHHYRNTKRGAYTGVKARWRSIESRAYNWELAGSVERTTELVETFATQEDATEAAKAEWNRLQRGLANLTISMAAGRPEVGAEMKLKCLGVKKEIDQENWVIVKATHSIGPTAFTTHLEAETGK